MARRIRGACGGRSQKIWGAAIKPMKEEGDCAATATTVRIRDPLNCLAECCYQYERYLRSIQVIIY